MNMKFRRICIILGRRLSVILLLFIFGLLIFKLCLTKSKTVFQIIDQIKMYETNVVLEDDNISREMISSLVKVRNTEQKITNIDAFGPVISDTTILVVMVDKYYINDGIKILLESLEKLNGMEEVLVIFSYSHYDHRLDKIIQNIDYCRVLQIYYPYSVQLHPNEFPGQSRNDCPYNINPKKAVSSNCIGAHTPDVKGRYRVPYETQKKHHWWWTANTVFEKLSFSTKHTGIVIFLDDHLIFMKDLIYMATYMKNIADLQPRCEFLSFGSNSLSDFNDEKDFYGIELSFWDPKNYWNILAFDVSVWNSIVPHYDLFCSFDESSWIRSLYYISLNRKDGKRYKVLSSMAPRAFRVGHRCLLYQKCDQSQYLWKINEFEERNIDNWFPPFLEMHINLEHQDDDDVYDMIEGNGGFADPRDKALCHNMTVSKIKKVVLEMKYEFRDSV